MKSPVVWLSGILFFAIVESIYSAELKDDAKALAAEGVHAAIWQEKSAAERETTIVRLRAFVNNWENPDSSDSLIALLNLNDETAISETIRVYQMGRFKTVRMTRIMQKCRQPLLISIFAVDLRNKEPIDARRDGELLAYPIAYYSSCIVLSILENTPVFSPEVKECAAKTKNRREDRLVDEVRRFWDLNGGSFALPDYAAVKAPAVE